MTRKHWTVEIDGAQHTVEFDHGDWSGKRTLTVDGEILTEDSGGLTDGGDDYPFTLAGKPSVVRLDSQFMGLQRSYTLVVDGKAIP